MIVHDFDLCRAFRRPDETHSELVVDADRVLSPAIPSQRFEAIAGRRPQIAEIARGVEIARLPTRHLDQIGRKALRAFTVENGFAGLIPKVFDRKPTCITKRYMIQGGVSIADTTSWISVGPFPPDYLARKLGCQLLLHPRG